VSGSAPDAAHERDHDRDDEDDLNHGGLAPTSYAAVDTTHGEPPLLLIGPRRLGREPLDTRAPTQPDGVTTGGSGIARMSRSRLIRLTGTARRPASRTP
jgi:hypothetical protein